MLNVCATVGGNTGDSKCPVKMGRPVYTLETSGLELSAADLQDSDSLKAAMIAGILAANSSTSKVFVSPKFNEAEDATGDPNLGTLGDGYEEVLNEPLNKIVLVHASNYCQQVAMSNLNAFKGKTYIIDDQGIFWYVTKTSGGGKGFKVANQYTPVPKFRGNAVNAARTRLVFADNAEFKSAGAIKLDWDVSSLPVLVDVVLDDRETGENSNSIASNAVFTIGGKTSCDGEDIYTDYDDALDNIDCWEAKVVATGAAITIDSVAKNDTDKGWDITLNASEFSGLATGTRFSIGLKAPVTLLAEGVEDIEGVAIKFKKA